MSFHIKKGGAGAPVSGKRAELFSPQSKYARRPQPSTRVDKPTRRRPPRGNGVK
jgi:hypothetical protein